MKAGARGVKEGGEAWQQQRQVAEAGDAGDEGRSGRGPVSNVQGDLRGPERLGDGGWRRHGVLCFV